MLEIEKEVFDCFVTNAVATILTTLPVFPSKIILGYNNPLLQVPKEDLNFSGILSF